MALKTRLACCLLLSLFVFVEMAASDETCDAFSDITVLLDFSGKLTMMEYTFQYYLFGNLLFVMFDFPNDIHLNIMFYHSFVLEILPIYKYGSFENYQWIKRTLQTSNDYRRENEGEDVITALMAASRPMPETDCRRKRGARRIIVVVADAVDESALELVPPLEFRNIMEERGVQIIALAVGNSSSLDVLDDILDPNYGDRIIKVDTFDNLVYGDAIIELWNELCEVTPEMISYNERLSASFRANFTYNGHEYYLSREEFDNLTQVHDTCSSADGYLAVMNDRQEYDAMKQYFTDNDPGYSFYTDGTDADTEVVWTLLSGASLPYVDWLDVPRPDKTDKDCFVWSQISGHMFDECDVQNHRYLFLCEVPDPCNAK